MKCTCQLYTLLYWSEQKEGRKKMECNILYSLDLLNSWINGNVLKHSLSLAKPLSLSILAHTHTHTRLKDNMAIKTIDWCRQYQIGEFHFGRTNYIDLCETIDEENGERKKTHWMVCHQFTLDTYMSPFCTLECYKFNVDWL